MASAAAEWRSGAISFEDRSKGSEAIIKKQLFHLWLALYTAAASNLIQLSLRSVWQVTRSLWPADVRQSLATNFFPSFRPTIHFMEIARVKSL